MIEALDLSKSYDGVEALAGVRFTVPAGQVCGFVGPNGAGKTTTIKLLAGILRPTAGTARLCGHDVVERPLEARRVLGYVPEGGGLYTLLTPREHLALVADLHEVPPAEAAERAATLTDLLDLRDLADRRIDSLSKGQRQKVLVACALLHDPQVVLFDEPFDGLDANAVLRLKELIRGLAARGRTVLFCSHMLDVVERLCDRSIVVHRGRVVADGPTPDLVRRSGAGTLEALFQALTAGAAPAASAVLDALAPGTAAP
ncbi:MAG: ABC transporter ATP-binding protein [Planctomycetes bacterium]|nr:ABC transporter ATP-binding protein [Planctomycetota bacterium]